MRGTLVDAETKAPIRGEVVGQGANAPPYVTGADGRFDLPNDAWVYVARAPGYAGAELWDVPTEGSLIALSRTVAISGVVLDSGGKPVPNALVESLPQLAYTYTRGLRPLATAASTTTNGTFVIDAYPPESVLTVSVGGVRSLFKRIQVRPTGAMVLTLPFLGTIRGTVITPEGMPVAGATVGILGSPVTVFGLTHRTTTTASDGTFAVEGLSPGGYSITSRTGALFWAKRKTHDRVDLPEGADIPLELTH